MENLPDHELIVTAAELVVGIRRREQIIGDVGAHIAALVPPHGHAGDAADAADDALVGELAARVRVALDVVLAAGPRPVRVPRHAVGVDAVDVGALVARARAGTPLVVVEVPALAVVVVELAAELLGETQGREAREEEEAGLHLSCLMGRVSLEQWMHYTRKTRGRNGEGDYLLYITGTSPAYVGTLYHEKGCFLVCFPPLGLTSSFAFSAIFLAWMDWFPHILQGRPMFLHVSGDPRLFRHGQCCLDREVVSRH